MKKTAALFFAIIFFSAIAAAAAEPELEQAEAAEPSPVEETTDDEKNFAWTFSLEGKLGTRIGVYDEIVWTKRKFDGERYKRSELNYELTPLVYTGIDFKAAYKRLELKFLSKFFFNQKAGILKDSDWENDDLFSNGDIFTKTSYSEHDLYLNSKYGGFSGFDLELQGAFNFYPTEFLTLSPLVSFNAQCMNFSAQGGTGWYGAYDKNRKRMLPYSDPTTAIVIAFENEKVLEYEVYNMFAWTGIRADFKINSWLNVSLASELSPFSVFYDFDKHLSNKREFKELAFSSFFAFRQTVKSEIKIQNNFSICQTCVFMFTGESEGAMYYKESSEESYRKLANNTGGGQLICLDLELSAKILW